MRDPDECRASIVESRGRGREQARGAATRWKASALAGLRPTIRAQVSRGVIASLGKGAAVVVKGRLKVVESWDDVASGRQARGRMMGVS